MTVPWAKPVRPFLDPALAAAMAAAGLLATVGSTPLSLGGTTSIVGPRPVVAASYVLAAAALAMRRRWPFAVLLAAGVALGVPFALYGASEGFSAIAPVFIALYTVGAHTQVPRAFAALCVYAGFWALLELRNPLNPDLRSVVGSWPLCLVGVMLLLFGAFLRTRRLYVAELRARAESAEADREERVRAATLDERARIARELHDAVAHAITVMVMQAEAADEILERDLARSRIAIQQVQRAGREGLAEMRRLLGVLRPDLATPLTPQPGLAALGGLISDISTTGVSATLAIDGEPRALPTGIEISAYRIVQEALTNVIKHAGARSVGVRVGYCPDELAIEIVDDGARRPRRTGRGHGLIGMQERVDLYGGALRVGPVAGGFEVRATFPLERQR